MIGIVFQFGNEYIKITVEGANVYFQTSATGYQNATIDNLSLSYDGVVKEFPYLKDNPNWKEEAIKKFKEKIKSFKNEDEIVAYLIDDLTQYGYVPRYKQKAGHRVERIAWHG